jgi:hypothetical protein
MTDLPRDLAHVVRRAANNSVVGLSGSTSFRHNVAHVAQAYRRSPAPAAPPGIPLRPKHASWLKMVEIEIGNAWTNASTATSASFPSLMK